MSLTIHDRLGAGEVVLIDGATGTELERLGVPMVQGAWCANAARTHPDVLKQVHESHIAAGAKLITANTYASSRHLLEFGGLGSHFELLNRLPIEIALSARAARGTPDVVIAGSMSSSRQGGPFPPVDIARRNFADQAQIQAEAGAELLMLEMMRDIDQTRACLEAAQATGLPIWLGWACHVSGDDEPMLWERRHTLHEAMEAIDVSGIDLVAIMHTDVDEVDPCLDVIDELWPGPVGVYAHSGRFEHPHWVFNDVISPDDYATYVSGWVERGVRAIGGCCGITADHIAVLASKL